MHRHVRIASLPHAPVGRSPSRFQDLAFNDIRGGHRSLVDIIAYSMCIYNLETSRLRSPSSRPALMADISK